jgi:hypothetical protein
VGTVALSNMRGLEMERIRTVMSSSVEEAIKEISKHSKSFSRISSISVRQLISDMAASGVHRCWIVGETGKLGGLSFLFSFFFPFFFFSFFRGCDFAGRCAAVCDALSWACTGPTGGLWHQKIKSSFLLKQFLFSFCFYYSYTSSTAGPCSLAAAISSNHSAKISIGSER